MGIIQYKMQEHSYVEKDLKDYVFVTIMIPIFCFIYILFGSYLNYSFKLGKYNIYPYIFLTIALQYFMNLSIFRNAKIDDNTKTTKIKVNRQICLSIILFPIFWIILAIFTSFFLHENKRFLLFVKQVLLLFPIQLFINIIIAFFYTETKNNN